MLKIHIYKMLIIWLALRQKQARLQRLLSQALFSSRFIAFQYFEAGKKKSSSLIRLQYKLEIKPSFVAKAFYLLRRKIPQEGLWNDFLLPAAKIFQLAQEQTSILCPQPSCILSLVVAIFAAASETIWGSIDSTVAPKLALDNPNRAILCPTKNKNY